MGRKRITKISVKQKTNFSIPFCNFIPPLSTIIVNSDIFIYPIEQKDNPIIASIIRNAMTEFNADPKTTILGDPTLDAMFENYLSDRSIYYILKYKGEYAGGCGIKHLDHTDENICELQRMFLNKSVRGLGLGKILIDLCLDKAREFHYEKIYLETLSPMKAAIHLYEKTGFRKINQPLGQTGHTGCDVQMIMAL